MTFHLKFVFLLFLPLGLFTGCNAVDTKNNESRQPEPAAPSAKVTTLQWLDPAHQQLGKIKAGQVVDISWRFKNTGNEPLIISNATASCGCTVAEKPEEPIAPGKEGIIKAKFDSHGREGEQRKQVFVTANTQDNVNQELSFQVVVEK